MSNLIQTGNNLSPAEMSKSIKQRVMDGDLNPLEVHASMKKISKVVEAITKDKELLPLVSEEADKHGGKEFEAYGCKMVKTATSTKYDFKASNHPTWNALNRILTTVKAEMKTIEEELKKLGPEQVMEFYHTEEPKFSWDGGTGEMHEVYAPKKIQSYGVKVFVK